MQHGNTWQGMTTNISKFNAAFSDFPWPEDSPIFPTAEELHIYVERYAKHFNIFPHISFNCEVVDIAKKDDGGKTMYEISWKDKGKTLKKQVFQYIAIAAGIFANPVIPAFKGLQNFKG